MNLEIEDNRNLKRIADRLASLNLPIEPPSGLADRTIEYCLMLAPVVGPLSLLDHDITIPKALAERTSQMVLAADAIPSTLAHTYRDEPVVLGKRRADLIVAAMIAFVVVGLGITGVQKIRADASRAACQNHLRELHTVLTDYADHHRGLYPAGNHAGDFVGELNRSGYTTAMRILWAFAVRREWSSRSADPIRSWARMIRWHWSRISRRVKWLPQADPTRRIRPGRMSCTRVALSAIPPVH
jgi:hypothetical protein